MQGIYYRNGATVAAPGFPKEDGGQANSLFGGWGGGGFSIYQSSYYFAKIKVFNDFFFFIKMKKLKEKFKNFRVWETRIINS